jgi:hypothetical protein
LISSTVSTKTVHLGPLPLKYRTLASSLAFERVP